MTGVLALFQFHFFFFFFFLKKKKCLLAGKDGGSYGPFSTSKNGFRSISLKKISVLDSYFINRYIIIKYRSSSI